MKGTRWLGRVVEVEVEAPVGSFVKRDPSGAIGMISPLPLPWNYGHVVGEMGGDGDPLDAIVPGARRAPGSRATLRVYGVVDFEDAGRTDLKLVCGATGVGTRAAVAAFFAIYPWVKRAVYAVGGAEGPTRAHGIAWWVPGDDVSDR